MTQVSIKVKKPNLIARKTPNGPQTNCLKGTICYTDDRQAKFLVGMGEAELVEVEHEPEPTPKPDPVAETDAGPGDTGADGSGAGAGGLA